MFSELNYIHRSKVMRQLAKKSLGYLGTRPGKDKEIMDRPLFGPGGRYSPEQVTQMIDEAPDNTLFWRFIFNPDPVLENPEKLLDLRELTQDAIHWLEARIGKDGVPRNLPFVAAIHDDHTPLAHVHGIFLMERQGRERPITPKVINEFREYVAGRAIKQRQERELGRTIAQGLSLQEGVDLQQQQTTATETFVTQDQDRSGNRSESDGGGGGGTDLAPLSSACPSCLVGTLSKRLNSKIYECSECGYAQRLGREVRRGRGKERDYARSY